MKNSKIMKFSTIHLRIRDPFILPNTKDKRYYLYGTTSDNKSENYFQSYWSFDLENWQGPYNIFSPGQGFWADRDFWAPEVYEYNGRFYMFASFKSGSRCRGTQVLVADNPLGEFVEHSQGAITPSGWECLDGSLFIDRSGRPWMIFCREWLEVADGRIYAVRLSDTLDKSEGEPILLFSASQANWTGKLKNIPASMAAKDCYVTDGPFMFASKDGGLCLLWSSFNKEGKYSAALSRCGCGRIEGDWIHDDVPLYSEDGGHSMLFKTFDSQTKAVLHTPNKYSQERMLIMDAASFGCPV